MARLPSSIRSGARRVSLVAAIFAMQCTLVPTGALAQVIDAKGSLANGDKAARSKDWPTASTEYSASNKVSPSSDALDGLANAHYQQKHDAEAYAAYEEWLKTYAVKNPGKKANAEARLKELAGRTGLLAIETAEPGATITVDDKPMGTTPLTAPLRLGLGPHRVRVTKDGFLPFDQAPNIAAGATSTVQVTLAPQSTKGHVNVREKTGKPLRVILDGVDMGEAPWSADVDAGPHDIAGRSGSMIAAPEKIVVERGKTRDVELIASSTTATLKIGTSDGKGLIYLDGKLVGEGTFTSDIPAGTHAIRITREGYDAFEEQMELKDKETLSRSITLKLSSKIETGAVQKEGRRLEGLYGGFGLLMTVLPGGMKSSMQKTCDDSKPTELGSCSGQGGGIGGGVDGFIGYHWDPVGVELFLGAQYDQSTPKLSWNASSTDPGIGADPARTEDFSVHRVGGFGILRVRLTLQGEKLRFSVAGGVGLSYRSLLMTRDTTGDAASAGCKAVPDKPCQDAFVPDAQSYLSPILSLDPSVQYRLSPTTAVALGLTILVESPRSFDQIPTTKQEGGHRLGGSGLTTPAYELATGTQVYMGPFIGMMFGP